MRIISRTLLLITLTVLFYTAVNAQIKNISTKVLVLAENGGHHIEFTKAAKPWLTQLAHDNNFSVDFIENTSSIDENFLSQYQAIIQLDYPPYAWRDQAVVAFEKYIEEGRGGWIGLHHATLLGEFDGYPMWQWFHEFMGGIKFQNYISTFASGQVSVEDKDHPCMKDVSSSFIIQKEQWYTYDKSPRESVHVIASVDESTYTPSTDIKMGDHPVIWSNEKFPARNLYIFMGHSPELLQNKDYAKLLRNSIMWILGK